MIAAGGLQHHTACVQPMTKQPFAITEDIRTVDASLLAHLQTWQGKTETQSDTITAAPVT